MLQARWGIVRQSTRSWHLQRITNVLMARLILHNMIIEVERGEDPKDFRGEAPVLTMRREMMPLNDYLAEVGDLESYSGHYNLRNNLIKHLWKRKGG